MKVNFMLLIVFLLFLAGYYYYVYSRYNYNSPILDEIRSKILLLSPHFSLVPIREGGKAFTENKSVITICTKDPSSGKYYDMNTLMYVTIHELSHILTRDLEIDTFGKVDDHGPKFTENFQKLLKKAALVGIYDPQIPIPRKYCGVES